MKGGGLPLKFSYKCMLHFPQGHFGDKVKMYEETGGTPPPKHTFLRGVVICVSESYLSLDFDRFSFLKVIFLRF